MSLSIRNVKFIIKMHWFTMFITTVCVLFLIVTLRICKKNATSPKETVNGPLKKKQV